MTDIFKVAVCQMLVSENKQGNILKASNMVEKCAKEKAEVVVLPEMFNCPYDKKFFLSFAEDIEGETVIAMAQTARKNKVYLIAGSIPEKDGNKIYNTSFVFDKNGNIIGKHRKIHLFDIDIKGKISFRESEVLSAGQDITVVQTKYCKIGIGICYDIRFPEIHRIMALNGAKMIIVPAAFNMVTGPAHWETTFRMRAIDNQVFVIGAAPARAYNSSYISYANSIIVDPFGRIIAKADDDEMILTGTIDLGIVDKVREELPLLKHRRTDIY